MEGLSLEPAPEAAAPPQDEASASPPPAARPDVGVSPLALPTARRTLSRLLRAWLVGLLFFGYGPAFTYGYLTWLLNERQWAWTYLMYFTLVPVVGGCCVLLLPWVWYGPIHRTLARWSQGSPPTPQECRDVYERALHLPWQVAMGAFAAAALGYGVGSGVVHWMANQPWIEIAKTMPAVPLVGGMMGAFCYYGTVRALYPLVAWCSHRLQECAPAVKRVSMAEKFLTTTSVLAVAILCLILPAAYTLGQVVTEAHLQDRALSRLRVATRQMAPFARLEDRLRILGTAILGAHGYAFGFDLDGRIVTPHPRSYVRIEEERFFRFADHFQGREGVWVDRVGAHRVVAYARLASTPMAFLAVAYPDDFAAPLRHFVLLACFVIAELLVVVIVFGRYYTRGITTPLAALTATTERIAQGGDLDQRAPITTNDELSELARSFNRMVERLQASKGRLEEYTRRLEQSTRDLSALNQEMEDLLRVVSHDLRAPLINIQGFTTRLEPVMREATQVLERLAAQSPDPAARAEAATVTRDLERRFTESLRFISKGVEKMDALLSSLLAVSRVGRKADPLRPNNLNEILDDVLATFDHQLRERSIKVLRHPLPAAVPCRRNEINQVFSNILANAIQYMGPSAQRFIEIGGTEGPDAAECYVRDTGVGIAPEDHGRIFQMFTRLLTVDVPGEGVGLAYVKKILRSHGGTIRVVSQRGQGSTFLFTLPMGSAATRG